MIPTILHLGPLPLHSFGLMMVLAFLTAWRRFYISLAEGGELRWLFVWLLPGPVLGVIAMLPLWRGEGTHAG